MRTLLPVLLLLAACGGGGAEQKTAMVAVPDLERVVVRVKRGALAVHTGEAGKVQLDARLPDQPGVADFVQLKVDGGTLRVEASPGYEDAALEVDLTVPAGIDLTAVGSSAAISIDGRWSEVRVLTGVGPIHVDAEQVASGKIESCSGPVSVSLRVAPSGNLVCKSVGGDTSVTMPREFRGRVHVSTQAGRCDVKEGPDLRVTWDPARKAALAFHGEPLTEAERKKELEERQSPQAIWVESGAGTASFAIAD